MTELIRLVRKVEASLTASSTSILGCRDAVARSNVSAALMATMLGSSDILCFFALCFSTSISELICSIFATSLSPISCGSSFAFISPVTPPFTISSNTISASARLPFVTFSQIFSRHAARAQTLPPFMKTSLGCSLVDDFRNVLAVSVRSEKTLCTWRTNERASKDAVVENCGIASSREFMISILEEMGRSRSWVPIRLASPSKATTLPCAVSALSI